MGISQRRTVCPMLSRAAFALVLLASSTPPAAAQLGPAGPALTLNSSATPGIGTDLDFDPVYSIFLVVGGDLHASVLSRFGGSFKPGFSIATPSPTSEVWAPRVRYSPDLVHGSGGFLVTWFFRSVLDPHVYVHARVVTLGGPVGPEFELGAPAISFSSVAVGRGLGPAVAYSLTSHEFLVVGPGETGAIGQRLNADAEPVGVPILIPSISGLPISRSPTVSWNPDSNEFAVVFSVCTSDPGSLQEGAIEFARVTSDGEVARRVVAYREPRQRMYGAEIDFNVATRNWLIAWYQIDNQSPEVPVFLTAEVGAAGEVLAINLASTAVSGGGDSIGLAYNPATGTFLLAGLDRYGSGSVVGVELDAHGARRGPEGVSLNQPGDESGAYYPRALATPGQPTWFVSFSSLLTTMRFQNVSTLPTPGSHMAIDPPDVNQRYDFTLTGWAIDLDGAGTGVDMVVAWGYPLPGSGAPPVYLGAARYGNPRPDVAAAYGSKFRDSGFIMQLRYLTPGSWQIRFYARSTAAGGFNAFRSAHVNVLHSLQGWIDSPGSESVVGPSFTVTGWAADFSAPSGSGVDGVYLWAFPEDGGSPFALNGTSMYGLPRPDVAAYLGPLWSDRVRNSGYRFSATGMPAGRYRVVTYVHETTTGHFFPWQSVNVTVVSGTAAVIGAIDFPPGGIFPPAPSTLDGIFTITGWALDPRATGPPHDTGVEEPYFWAFPFPNPDFPYGGAYPVEATVRTGLERPDIAALYGERFRFSGYSATIRVFFGGTLVAFVRHHSGQFEPGFFQTQSFAIRLR